MEARLLPICEKFHVFAINFFYIPFNLGWINTFLSWPAFIPLSRMSYIIYLTHLSVMGVLQGTTFYQMEGTNIIMVSKRF